MEPQKHGFINSPVEPKDFIFGGKTKLKGEVIVPDGNWEKYLFDGIESHQAPEYETNACVSHSSANALELLKRRMHDKTPDFSDRFIAKGSGTNPAQGNTFKAVADFIRKSWAVYEHEWPIKGIPNVDEYYSEIPEPLFSIAKARKRDFGYERIINPSFDSMHEAAKRGVVVFSIAYMPKGDGTYYRPDGWQDGHAITFLRLLDNGLIRILDSYPPFIKDVHPFIPDAAYRYGLDELQYSLLTQLAGLLKQLLEMLKKNYYPPKINPKDPSMNQGKIKEWAKAIGEFESGGNPNSLSMKLNNPGAMKYTTYTASLGGKKGPAGTDGGFFCKFDTMFDGHLALEHFLIDACRDKLISYNSTMSLDKFTQIYANVPPGHNYQKTVAQKLNVPLTTTIGTLV